MSSYLRLTKTSALGALSAAILVALTGCGSDSDNSSSGGSTTAPPTLRRALVKALNGRSVARVSTLMCRLVLILTVIARWTVVAPRGTLNLIINNAGSVFGQTVAAQATVMAACLD